MKNIHEKNIVRVLAVVVLVAVGGAIAFKHTRVISTTKIQNTWESLKKIQIASDGGESSTKKKTTAPAEPSYPPTDQTSISLGKKLYYSDRMVCYTCHGEYADGGDYEQAPNLIDNVWLIEDSRVAFHRIINEGTEDQAMPATPLTLQEADAIRAFLETLKDTSR